MTERVIPNLVFFYVDKDSCKDPFVSEVEVQRSILKFIESNGINGAKDFHVKIPLDRKNEVIGIGFIRSCNLELCNSLRKRKSMEDNNVEVNNLRASTSSGSAASTGSWADMVEELDVPERTLDFSMFNKGISIQPAVIIKDEIDYKFFIVRGSIKNKGKIVSELSKCCYNGKVKPSSTIQRTTTSFVFDSEDDGFIASCFHKFITVGNDVFGTCSPKRN